MSWRDLLRPASFRGAEFHVEVISEASGRRSTMYEFPKRDDPMTEDMGRVGRRFSVTGYLIGPNYHLARDALLATLEREGAGLLVHPTRGAKMVVPGPYNQSESRTRGGYCEVDMVFLEAGQQSFGTRATADTQANAKAAAETGAAVSSEAADKALASGSAVAT